MPLSPRQALPEHHLQMEEQGNHTLSQEIQTALFLEVRDRLMAQIQARKDH